MIYDVVLKSKIIQIIASLRVRNLLFCTLLALVPFAEWRFIGVPIKGRPIVIDLNGYLSASVFDIIFVLFVITCLPAIWKAYKNKDLINPYLLCWAFCFLIVFVLFFQQDPSIPHLTPSKTMVIDVRSFIIHCAVAIFVALAAIRISLSRIIKGACLLYGIIAFGAAVLCYLALSAFPFFQFNYPFNTPASISFPFASQNMAALFMNLCFIGLIGASANEGNKWLYFIASPIFLFAAALTGSRSNIIICVFVFLCYYFIYSLYHRSSLGDPIIKEGLIRPALIPGGLFLGFCLIFFYMDWHPVARSMSIFQSVWENPLEVLKGGPKGAPRRELMSRIITPASSESDSPTDESTHRSPVYRYALGLVSVTEGCKTLSNTISGLRIDRPYYIQLKLVPNAANHTAVLNVFGDIYHKQLIGSVEMNFQPLRKLSKIYYLLADTGNYRISLQADLAVFRKQIGATKNYELGSQTLSFFHEPFTGGAGPSVNLTRDQIQINADSVIMRSFVADNNEFYFGKESVILDYVVTIRNTILSIYDPPVAFYVGLGSGIQYVQKSPRFIAIQDGLFIRHELLFNEEQAAYSIGRQLEKYLYWCSRNNMLKTDPKSVFLFNKEIRCGQNGQNSLSRFEDPFLPEDVDTVIAEHSESIYRITKKNSSNIKSILSVQTEKNWSAEQTLAGRGSSHNVYLDWYYYAGAIPFTLFLCFIVSLLGAFTHFTWKSRFSNQFPFILSIFSQLLIILLMMYWHPYLFLKYIWFVFGMATAVMIHPDLREKLPG